ncbi:MAG: hypothetical protein M1834_009554 [Cirrosporium novae-zelandiae]|nr:MAG: hypothetical protein M1834_009554 [Cirrosporium novae-zelandiae]
MKLFHDALQGVHFLHSHGWIHGDLKPGNIGINGARAILLDIGGAMQLHSGTLVPPTPGHGGTLWYLAPEREMQGYNCLVDVWAMGIIGYELACGNHPWKFFINPWRSGADSESLRPTFHAMYRESIDRIRRSKAKRTSQISELIIQMLRHQWAEGNQDQRIRVQDALEHPCWQFEGDEPPMKKMRLSAA